MIKKFILYTLLFSNFILIETEYSKYDLIGKGNIELQGENYKLQKEVSDAFLLLKAEALKSGFNIQVVSSYRSFEHQKRIWTRKYKKFTSQGMTPQKAINKIIEYSTIPGTSRHHWGTDIDIIDGNIKTSGDVLNPKHFKEGGLYHKFKIWLDENADRFGFCLVYTDIENRKGFKYEPWHYSYESISKEMLKQYLKIDIQQLLKEEKLLGSDYFNDVFIEKYIRENILDINPDLK
ncbi:M15 family metallopeptidase [Urechidicola croceus]|uniref:D-alanyl-D-alanine carboxypeptidase n=1 Tax=Urechidicola croceus TaxID=1850246 RepID=A0A1D8P5P8_9FLAO|nr:M15 family metallopeptidase [Urechidicola croceus]AOW19886.1 D-alanyl-D-alanine carboxypeptidase [Urechidicola croceus]